MSLPKALTYPATWLSLLPSRGGEGVNKRQKGLSTDNQQILGPGLKQYVGDGNRGKEGPKSHQRESRGNLKRVAGREQLSSWLNNHFLPIQEEAAVFLDITG